MADAKKLRVRLVKGLMGTKQEHRATARGLGLKWRNHCVELPDTPAIRGMINRIAYLVEVTEAG
jgi:large subunit ribosomal protein L30